LPSSRSRILPSSHSRILSVSLIAKFSCIVPHFVLPPFGRFFFHPRLPSRICRRSVLHSHPIAILQRPCA
jgi:hypothetical protein